MPTSSNGEVAPLVGQDNKYAAKQSIDWKRILLATSVLVAGSFFLFVGSSKPEHVAELHQTIHAYRPKPADTIDDAVPTDPPFATTKTATVDRGTPPPVMAPGPETTTQQQQQAALSSSTILDTAYFENLQQKLAVAKQQLAVTMTEDYGPYFDTMFFDNSTGTLANRGRSLFTSGDESSTLSWDRLVRKLKLKLLTPQPQQFIWATGGHSATAAHGNFYTESYTAYMERAVAPVFAAIGLPFTGRNYAMGGTWSSPELALCEEEIYGQDIDVLVWDFGMTDGKALWKQVLFHYRAGFNKARPVTIAYHAGGSNYHGRIAVAKELETLGLSCLISSEKVMTATTDAVPDSFGLEDAEIEQLPLYVRNFRCGSQIENGDPYCKDRKFNETMCTKRKGKTSWHPGWKWQAVMGNLAAFFMIEVLDDTLAALSTTTIDLSTLAAQLKTEEDADYKAFFDAPVPESLSSSIPEADRVGLDFDLLNKGHTFCHTGKLPAEIRHKGLLTETTQIGFTTYDKGIGRTTAAAEENPGENMRLVFEEGEREVCERTVHMDYKDFFYFNKKDSWKKLLLPNDAEFQEYGNGHSVQGLVAICFTVCSWGKCPKGNLGRDDLALGMYEFQINGVNVTDFVKYQECEVLKNAEGFMFKPDADGRLDIQARVSNRAEDGSYVRVSSFILW